MKKILYLLIILVLIFTACTKKQEVNSLDEIINRDTLIVGVREDAGVFGHVTKEGSHEGFDIDVAKYCANKILGNEKKIRFVTVTSNTRLEAITSKQVDMVIATMSKTRSRQYLIDFSIPYYIAGQTAVVKEDSNIHTFSDLRDKTTIVVLGSTAEQNLRRIVPTVRILGYPTYKEAFNALIDGKGDALSTDDTIISGFMSEHKGYRVLKNRISTEHYAIGIRKTDDQTLKQFLDNIIKDMQRDGTLKSLKEKWLFQ